MDYVLVKRCTSCDQEKSLEEFHRSKGKSLGRQGQCKLCVFKAGLKRKYNMSFDQYNSLFKSQGYCCKVCKSPEPIHSPFWQIDHDHKCCPKSKKSCGKCIRGILCARCNFFVGKIEKFEFDFQSYINSKVDLDMLST